MVGFTDENISSSLDLNALVIQHPAATFFVRAEGDAMAHAGICSGDLLVVDRSQKPSNGKIIIAIVDGEFVVRRLSINEGRMTLVADNSSSTVSDLQVWGVVTYIIHKAE